MSTLYKIKLLALPETDTIIRVQLIPTNDTEGLLSPLVRTIRIAPERMQEISTLATEEEQLVAYRQEILKGDAGYQSDWESEKVRKTTSIPEAMTSRIGDEFPATTQEELDALHSSGDVPVEDREVVL